MNFISLKFIVFLFVVFIIYYMVPVKFRKYILLLSSLTFYFYYDYKLFIFVLIAAITSFVIAIYIEKIKENAKTRKKLLAFSIVIIIGILIVLKYGAFIFENIFRLEASNTFLLLMPLGISFYSLQLVGYLIDVYRGDYISEKNFINFLLFVTYFPQILQGPIPRYNNLMPQLIKENKFDYLKIKAGIHLMLWGFFKKMVIADRASIFVNQVYGNIDNNNGLNFWIASILYSIQIYADFSGCVDIAMGASQILGIDLQKNFNQPYFAISIRDFWRRWHISLSSWFRDYLYISLGGNKNGVLRKQINVLIVFLVSGIWHGVGLNFIIWGMLHGLYQILGDVLYSTRNLISKILLINKKAHLYRIICILATFFLVNFAWIFFRISNFQDALDVINSMFVTLNPISLMDGSIFTQGLDEKDFKILIFSILIMLTVDILHENKIKVRESIQNFNLIFRWGLYLLAIFSILIFGVYGIGYNEVTFIYMQF